MPSEGLGDADASCGKARAGGSRCKCQSASRAVGGVDVPSRKLEAKGWMASARLDCVTPSGKVGRLLQSDEAQVWKAITSLIDLICSSILVVPK